MKAKELRTKSEKELNKLAEEQRGKLVDAYIDLRTKEVKNVKQIKAIKKDIARILTVTTENQAGQTETKS